MQNIKSSIINTADIINISQTLNPDPDDEFPFQILKPSLKREERKTKGKKGHISSPKEYSFKKQN